jgi:type III secretion protein Q
MFNTQHTLLDAFQLSRIGACTELDETRLCANYKNAGGPGLRLETHCDGRPLSFWMPEQSWCTWLAPQLDISNFAAVGPAWTAVLANWTLIPLNELLQRAGLPPCDAASIQPATAPIDVRWEFVMEADSRRLPLVILDAPWDWIQPLLAALEPGEDQMHTLALGLGWCLLQEHEWSQLCIGDALRIDGAGEDLSEFWLHPTLSPGRIQIQDDGSAQVLDCATGASDAPDSSLRINIEVGHATVPATALANWVPEEPFTIQYARHPELRLMHQNRLLAQGRLLRLDDGWAVRVDTKV